MNRETGKYIIPPRLKARLTLFGFYPEELLVILPAALLGLQQKLQTDKSFLLILAAILSVLWFRGFDNKSALTYLKLLCKYYLKPQAYTLKECDASNEDK